MNLRSTRKNEDSRYEQRSGPSAGKDDANGCMGIIGFWTDSDRILIPNGIVKLRIRLHK